MPKRSSVDVAAPSKRPSRDVQACTTCIVSGPYAEGKAAVTRCLLKELKAATVIASDLHLGRQAVPNKGPFDVKDYKTETPQLSPQNSVQNVVVLAHDLARPSSCLLYTSPSPRDQRGSRMPSSA